MIMKLSVLFALIQYVLICAYTPGPANFFALQTSSQYGYKRLLKVYPGLLAGCVTLFSVCTLISLFFREYIPQLTSIFTYLGMLYMLILAWKIWRNVPTRAIPENQTNHSVKLPDFRTGFLLNITNVKVMIFGFTLLQIFILPSQTSPLKVLLIAIGIAAFTTTGPLIWGWAGELFQKFLTKHYKICNTIMALMLVSCIFVSH